MQVRLTYAKRASYCKNALAKNLLLMMDKKKSNLALSADVTHCEDVLTLADKLGAEICVLKTHVDILEDFTPAFTLELRKLANKHHFLIFEDRKFADIGNTVRLQYEKGIYRIVDWADIVNAHTLPGPGIVSGLAEGGLKQNRGLLLLAEMSSANNLFTNDYAMQTLRMAEEFPEFVMGFISQRKLSNDPSWIYMTPGVQLKEGKDQLGQQYITPEIALVKHQTDIIIVGRGIIKAPDVLAEAKKYREAGWSAYEKQI
jgi:uridine monophosphate synthetase